MKHVRMAVLGLVVALLLGAMLTSVASAWGPYNSYWGGGYNCGYNCYYPSYNYCYYPSYNYCYYPTYNYCYYPTYNNCYYPCQPYNNWGNWWY